MYINISIYLKYSDALRNHISRGHRLEDKSSYFPLNQAVSCLLYRTTGDNLPR